MATKTREPAFCGLSYRVVFLGYTTEWLCNILHVINPLCVSFLFFCDVTLFFFFTFVFLHVWDFDHVFWGRQQIALEAEKEQNLL